MIIYLDLKKFFLSLWIKPKGWKYGKKVPKSINIKWLFDFVKLVKINKINN